MGSSFLLRCFGDLIYVTKSIFCDKQGREIGLCHVQHPAILTFLLPRLSLYRPDILTEPTQCGCFLTIGFTELAIPPQQYLK